MTTDELKKLLLSLGSRESVKILDELEARARSAEEATVRAKDEGRAALAEARARAGVFEERLKQAMAREKESQVREGELSAALEAALKENRSLAEQMRGYDERPDVRAKKRRALEKQIADLTKQAKALSEPEPVPKATPAGNPTEAKGE